MTGVFQQDDDCQRTAHELEAEGGDRAAGRPGIACCLLRLRLSLTDV